MVTAGPSSYTAVLDEAWARHLALRAPDAPTVVSLFAGCGGSSLGYSMAGYRELLAVEWDANAVATFRLNFPEVPVYHGDIAALSIEQALEMTGLQAGELDVLDGSPPCQGFSTAGKRRLADPRNDLFREYVRLLRGLQPKTFVMENVSGMVKGKMRLVFADCVRELRESGYQVAVRLMDAAYFGVPQHRQRLVFVGVHSDSGTVPSHPKPEVRPPSAQTACDDLPVRIDVPAPPFREWNMRLWQHQRPGQNGVGGRYFNHVRLDPSRPAPTISRSAVFGGFSGLSSWREPRALSLGELRRLGSFPDGFCFADDYEAGLNQIGNSVPPLFMEAIARHIRQHILEGAS